MHCLAGEVVLTTHFSDAEGVSGIDWRCTIQAHRATGYARSLANSAALLHFPRRAATARPGLMLMVRAPGRTPAHSICGCSR